jgi:hypothetical protein
VAEKGKRWRERKRKRAQTSDPRRQCGERVWK